MFQTNFDNDDQEIDPPGYDSLRRRSDQARLRSEDLRQDQEGQTNPELPNLRVCN